MERFDLVIIGGGSAGVAAAVKASELGAKIALIEEATIGGTCVNIGCVPTKNLLRAGEIVHLARQKNLKSVKGSQYVALNFTEALKEAREVVATLRRQKYEDRLEGLDRLFNFQGRAVFTGPHQIDIGGHKLEGKKILIATGASGRVPKIAGLDEAGCLTDADILRLKEPPTSLIVVGAGPLGLEFAQMFSHFGTRVRIIQRGPRILPRAEPQIAEAAKGFLEDEGIVIHTDEAVVAVGRHDGDKLVSVKAAGLDQKYRAEEVLTAVGRAPNTAGLGLEDIGVELDSSGAIVVNDEFVTGVPDIYAAGDVCGEPMLENVAVKEGMMAAANALGGERLQMDYDAVPSCTFTHPEVAQVGLTEAEAGLRGHRVEARMLSFASVPKAQITRDARGLIKMVANGDTGRILGCCVVADHAGDLINEAAIAVKQKMSLADLHDAVHAYPTMSEALVLVAEQFIRKPAEPKVAEKPRKAA